MPFADITPTDETVDVVLVLKAPWTDEKTLQSQLDKLVLSVEAQIVNSDNVNSPASPALTGDTIFNGVVPDVSDPFILVDEEESDSDEEASQFVYAAWKLPVLLNRPRMRLKTPSLVVTASAALKPEVKTELATGATGYLPSGVPSGLNLLESFRNDPALKGVKPRLSALRVSKVAPLTSRQDLMQHIRALQQLKLRINPVVHTRVRFSRPNTSPASPAVTAVLEIDFTQHFDCEVRLDKIKLSVPDSSIQSLTDNGAMQLPLSCVSHDHLVFLYHIAPLEVDLTGRSSIRELNISISATALVIPEVCTPTLHMAWTATVDFTTPVNPGFGPNPGTSSIHRAHRPSQLSVGNAAQAVTSLKSPSVTQPDALPGLEAAAAASTRAANSLPDLGITMSFTGPRETPRVGETFSWTVSIVNRSPASADSSSNPSSHRRFALAVIPKRRRNEMRAMRPVSSSSRRRGASVGTAANADEKDMANAVVDDNVLHAMQKSSVVGSTDVVCLSADTRVGPLAPGSCHVVDLQFLALKEGLVGVEAVRVIDLNSQEHVDIRDLPIMMVKPAA